MTKTQHYQLNQWDAGDRVLREDFNADNQKIDQTIFDLAAKTPKIIIGTYHGEAHDLGYNQGQTQEINLGFRPKIVFITTNTSLKNENAAILFGGMEYVYNNKVLCRITENGFMVGTAKYDNTIVSPDLNSKYSNYTYLAIG